MNINRDNYETFFLLYIDNELPVAERKAVEEFAALHTDLQEELQQLQEVILPTDDAPVFANKSSLLKSSFAGDTLEEKMLLLLDGELNTDEARSAEKMIASDEQLKKEWAVLLQTKSDPADTIIFANKQLLYRKEKDNVVAGRFIRWAVAAVLIGVGFFATVTFIKNKNEDKSGLADAKNDKKGSQVAKNPAESTSPANANNYIAPVTNTATATNNKAGSNNKKEAAAAEEQMPQKQQQQQLASNKSNTNNETILPVIKKEAKEDNLVLASNNNPKQMEKLSPEKTNQEMAVSALQKKPDLRDINVLDIQKNSIASTAAVVEEPNENRIFYMNEDDVTHSKAGGFFRKLKRTITRKTNIKTGNGLKIAGFEIAVK